MTLYPQLKIERVHPIPREWTNFRRDVNLSQGLPRIIAKFPPETYPPLNLMIAHHKCGTLWGRCAISSGSGGHGTAHYLLKFFARFHLQMLTKLEVARKQGAVTDLTEGELNLYREAFAKKHGIFEVWNPEAGLADFLRKHRYPFKAAVMIRDPRDIVVSAFLYHKWAGEPWCVESGWGEHLAMLNNTMGLLEEMRGPSGVVIDRLHRWNLTDPDVLVIRYEDAWHDPIGEWGKVYRHFGKPVNAKKISKCSIPTNSEITNKAHAQAGGRPGKWKLYFEPVHKKAFLQLFGDVLIRLGYETDDSWAA